MVTPDMLEEEMCCPRSSDSGERGGEVGSLGDRVHYDHHGIVTGGLWELDDEVHADRLPGCRWYGKGVQLSNWEVSLSFGVETEVAGGDILAYVPRHLWPPVISRHQFQCLPPSGMSSYLSVMAKCYGPLSQIQVVGHVDLSAEVQYTVGEGPFCRLN